MSKFIEGFGAPTTATPGFVDSLYIDMDTLSVYKCMKVTPAVRETSFVAMSDYAMETSEYTWEAVGGSGGGGAILAEMQEITFASTEYGTKVAYVTPSNFEEFDPDAIYIVHWNGTRVGLADSSFVTVAEPVKPEPNTIVDQEVGETYLYIQAPDFARTEADITVDTSEGAPRYRIFVNEPSEYYFNDTITIAIERLTSAIA